MKKLILVGGTMGCLLYTSSNLDSADAFSPVKTAVVADQDYRQAAGFQAALEEVSKVGEDRLLQLTRVETREEADVYKRQMVNLFMLLPVYW